MKTPQAKSSGRGGLLAACCLALAVVAAAASGGCVLSVDSDSRYLRSSKAVAESVDAIEVGATSREWVVERLGTPSSAYVNDSGNEVLRYALLKKRDVDVSLLLVFSVDASEEEVQTLHVEIEDGVVASYWFD